MQRLGLLSAEELEESKRELANGNRQLAQQADAHDRGLARTANLVCPAFLSEQPHYHLSSGSDTVLLRCDQAKKLLATTHRNGTHDDESEHAGARSGREEKEDKEILVAI